MGKKEAKRACSQHDSQRGEGRTAGNNGGECSAQRCAVHGDTLGVELVAGKALIVVLTAGPELEANRSASALPERRHAVAGA